MNTRSDVVSTARREVGTMESPPNSNMTKYGEWYGMNGAYWCAMFVSWVLDRVGNQSGYRFASTASSVAWARRQGRLRAVDQARPGDVMVKLYTSTSGHTGICSANEGSATVTIEGNTGGSDRDGGAVMERRRTTSFWDYCIGLDYDSAQTLPSAPPTQEEVRMNLGKINKPVCKHYFVPGDTSGGWFFCEDGGVFPWGSAKGYGSHGGEPLNAPIVDAAVAKDGYTLIAADGGTFPYGPGAPQVPSLQGLL